MAPKLAITTVRREQTGDQNLGRISSGSFPTKYGFSGAPRAGYKTWCRMRRNPTVAMARAATAVTIKSVPLSYSEKDDAPDGALDFIKGQIEPLRRKLFADLAYTLDYGRSSYELVMDIDRVDGAAAIVLRKIKALAYDLTTLVIDKSGDLAGIRQGKVEVPAESVLHVTTDSEAESLEGYSRHENVREDAWWPWMETNAQLGRYITKVAGIIPIISYPIGVEKDASGTLVDNYTIAMAILRDLGSGNGVAMPDVYAKFADQWSQRGVDMSKLKAWSIDFLETTGQHGADLLGLLKHYESLMMRGWLVPERVATEAQFGSRADAEAHTDIAVAIAHSVLEEFVEAINRQVIDRLIELNYGAQYKGTVYIEPADDDTESVKFIRTILTAVLANPMSIGMLDQIIDIDSMLDLGGLPKPEGSRGVVLIDDTQDTGVVPATEPLQASLITAYNRLLNRGQ